MAGPNNQPGHDAREESADLAARFIPSERVLSFPRKRE